MENITWEITHCQHKHRCNLVHVCTYQITTTNIIIYKSYPYFFEGSNGESKHSMATEKKLSDVEIESDDDYELDEIEEHELEVSFYLAQML